MKKSKFTEAQIVFALQQSETEGERPGDLSEDGDQQGDVLQLEKKFGGWRVATPAAARRRKCKVEADYCGLDSGQADFAGCAKKSFEDHAAPAIGAVLDRQL